MQRARFIAAFLYTVQYSTSGSVVIQGTRGVRGHTPQIALAGSSARTLLRETKFHVTNVQRRFDEVDVRLVANTHTTFWLPATCDYISVCRQFIIVE
jgi:hypothetical protein